MRRLTLTEEQFEAVMEALSAWDVYATMKSDDCVDPDEINEHMGLNYPELDMGSQEWSDKYEELEQAEVDRMNNIGGSMKEVLDQMNKMGTPSAEDIEVERVYLKHKDSIDRDWSTIWMWMYEAIPETMSEIEEEILQAEYGLTYEKLDDLEIIQSGSDIPYEESCDFKRAVIGNVAIQMLENN